MSICIAIVSSFVDTNVSATGSLSTILINTLSGNFFSTITLSISGLEEMSAFAFSTSKVCQLSLHIGRIICPISCAVNLFCPETVILGLEKPGMITL